MNSRVIRRIAYYFTRNIDGTLLGLVLTLMAVGLAGAPMLPKPPPRFASIAA